MEDPAMPAIVEFPTVVKEALAKFGHLFANEPERVHFAEYLTGLLVADRKNVSAINRQFAVTTDQSCLNRWLTELVDHDGKLIEDAGYFWDHAEQRYKIAHDYLIANYVCTSGKHYPLEFRRFVKRDQCEGEGLTFRDHNVLFRELIDWVHKRRIPGDFTFDSWFTHAANLNHIHRRERGYVGDLKFNRKVVFRGQTIKAEEVAALIGPEDRKPVAIGDRRQWYFTKSIRIPDVDHPVRIVILWDRWNSACPGKILVTNRTHWEISRILRVYRCRWRGTECLSASIGTASSIWAWATVSSGMARGRPATCTWSSWRIAS
jgi:hypothetical protein